MIARIYHDPLDGMVVEMRRIGNTVVPDEHTARRLAAHCARELKRTTGIEPTRGGYLVRFHDADGSGANTGGTREDNVLPFPHKFTMQELPPMSPAKIIRNESTDEGKRIWANVDAAAARDKRFSLRSDTQKVEALIAAASAARDAMDKAEAAQPMTGEWPKEATVARVLLDRALACVRA